VNRAYQHHYPLPEELGGTETIPVCARCHQLDHQLIDRLKQEVERGDIQLDLAGNDPYADRRAAIKAALERSRNQKRLLA
jgi:hypothetical protein